MTSGGGILFDPAMSLASWPPIPDPPAGGQPLDSAKLSANFAMAGSIRVSGMVEAGGADEMRIIRSTAGDIVVDGLLRAADLGGTSQGLTLQAPDGIVYITGQIESGGRDDVADGDPAGRVVIEARQVVITGVVRARGEVSMVAAGGAGGDITINAGAVLVPAGAVIDASGGRGATAGGTAGDIAIGGDGPVLLAGAIDGCGGNAGGAATASGGDGGDLRLQAGDDLQVLSWVRLRGGAATSAGADATGGAAGRVRIDAGGRAAIGGAVDARGGPAAAEVDGGQVLGGRAGNLHIGLVAPPSEIEVLVPMVNDGGAGVRVGGDGGPITLLAQGGDLRFAGTIQMDGGASRLAPGRGGVLTGDVNWAGGIRITGSILGRGGAATQSASADGGRAGDVFLRVYDPDGPFIVGPSGRVVLDGGDSSGSGRAGDGGWLDSLTRDGDASVHGRLFLRGGAAPDPGGTGGNGGPLYIYTDTDADGLGGNITIESDGIVDVSGGPGAHGGSATNNGEWGVEDFPDGRRTIAVLLNSDTAPEDLTDGVIQNLGKIVARGAAGDGWGGDLVFHGRRKDHYMDPLPGDLDLRGNGSGMDGQYFMQ